jgi:hypothetical protein
VRSADTESDRAATAAPPRIACRICLLARVHVLMVVILLAAWLAEPSWLAWARHTDRHFVPLVVLVVFVTLLAIKWRQHRTDRRQR